MVYQRCGRKLMLRADYSAVWDGTEMIVWGGYSGKTYGGRTSLNTGGRFNPLKYDELGGGGCNASIRLSEGHVIVHRSDEKSLRERLVGAYRGLRIGNPLDRSNLMGPLINHEAVISVGKAVRQVERQGGKVAYGSEPLGGPEYPGGCYMIPCTSDAEIGGAFGGEKRLAAAAKAAATPGKIICVGRQYC
jgi:hypothetical protein